MLQISQPWWKRARVPRSRRARLLDGVRTFQLCNRSNVPCFVCEIDIFVSAGIMQYTVGIDMYIAVFTFDGADYEVTGNLVISP